MKAIKLLLSIIFILAISIAFGQDSEIYVSDAANYTSGPWKILKFDENGDSPETYIADDIVWPQDIVFLEDQQIVLISSLKLNGYISKHDIATGDFVGYFAENINGPTRMKIGADGLLYVLQWYNGNNKVLRYEQNGTFVDEFTSTGIPQGIGLDWDSDGNLYVSSYSQDYVQKFDTDGNFIETFIDTHLVGPTNIWFDESGDLMVIDYDGGAVKRFNQDGEFVSVFIPELSYPEGIAFLENGKMLIGDGGSSSVKLINPDGSFIENFIPSGSGGLITPNAVVIREITSVTVDENQFQGSLIISSSGKKFRIKTENTGQIEFLEIFNLSGRRIAAPVRIADNWTWNANEVRKGIYLVTAHFYGGSVETKKVLVN